MPSPAGGVIFVNGNLTISASQTTSATIIATGSISITGGTTTINHPTNYPALVTQNQPITISGTGNSNPAGLVTTGLVYSGNDFSITGNHHTITVTNGAIIARGSLTGNSSGFSHNKIEVTYQKPVLAGLVNLGTLTMSINSYNT